MSPPRPPHRSTSQRLVVIGVAVAQAQVAMTAAIQQSIAAGALPPLTTAQVTDLARRARLIAHEAVVEYDRALYAPQPEAP